MNRRTFGSLALGYLVIVILVVVAARLGLYPGAGEVYPGDSPLSHPYRVAMGLTASILGVALGVGSALAGGALGSRFAGLTILLAGGIATGLLLSAAPWLLYPVDPYPVPFLWLMLGAPVGVLVWGIASLLTPVRSPVTEV